MRRRSRFEPRQPHTAASSEPAEHGSRGPTRRRRPFQQRARLANARFGCRHAFALRIRSTQGVHRPGTARDRGDGHPPRPERLRHSLQPGERPRWSHAGLHCGAHFERRRQGTDRSDPEGTRGPDVRRRNRSVLPRRAIPKHPRLAWQVGRFAVRRTENASAPRYPGPNGRGLPAEGARQRDVPVDHGFEQARLRQPPRQPAPNRPRQEAGESSVAVGAGQGPR